MTPLAYAVGIAAISAAIWSWSGLPYAIPVAFVAGGCFLLGWWERPQWAR